MEDFELPERPENHRDRAVGMIIATIAVVLAIVAALGHKIHNEEIIAHVDSTDQFAFYQAKKQRQVALTLGSDSIKLNFDHFSPSAQAQATALLASYDAEKKRLEDEGKEIMTQGNEKVAEARELAAKAEVLDVGEIALQISVVLCSLTILTDQRIFVSMGVITAGVGVVISLFGLLFIR